MSRRRATRTTSWCARRPPSGDGAQGDGVVARDDADVGQGLVVQLRQLQDGALHQPASLEPRRDADLADVGHPRLLAVDVDTTLRPDHDRGQGAVGLVPRDEDVAGVALDGGAQEVVGLPREAHADGAGHGQPAHERADLGLVGTRRRREAELRRSAHRSPSCRPWRLNDSRRNSGL